jgi:hypothetical protein
LVFPAGKVALVWEEGRYDGTSVTVFPAEVSGYSSSGRMKKVRCGEGAFVVFQGEVEASSTVGGS